MSTLSNRINLDVRGVQGQSFPFTDRKVTKQKFSGKGTTSGFVTVIICCHKQQEELL
jgi:hypothetical protein